MSVPLPNLDRRFSRVIMDSYTDDELDALDAMAQELKDEARAQFEADRQAAREAMLLWQDETAPDVEDDGA